MQMVAVGEISLTYVIFLIWNAWFSFSIIHLELKRQRHLYALVVPLKTIPNFRPKCSRSVPIFRPKWLKYHTLKGGTYLYSVYRGVTPPPLPPPRDRKQKITHLATASELTVPCYCPQRCTFLHKFNRAQKKKYRKIDTPRNNHSPKITTIWKTRDLRFTFRGGREYVITHQKPVIVAKRRYTTNEVLTFQSTSIPVHSES